MTMNFVHQPVMLDEIVDVFSQVPTGVFVDATLGGAGHASAILESRRDLRLVGVDRDPVAIDAASIRLADLGDRATLVRGRFGELDTILDANIDQDKVSLVGALFDLGVSSPQFDDPDRGFSFRAEAPLDMRMDSTQTLTASTIVNEYSTDEIARILRDYADERFALRIAKAIVASRPILTTTHLSEVVTTAIPAATRRTGRHPALRTFQAIRIAVNDELDQLEPALDAVLARLVVGARCAVLSYHSGEDRIVKRVFASAAGINQPTVQGLAIDVRAQAPFALVHRGARTSSENEVANNRRAESARLRTIERIQ
jgi:16S rRNA (cytosine1402-N4)-methyltransferase